METESISFSGSRLCCAMLGEVNNSIYLAIEGDDFAKLRELPSPHERFKAVVDKVLTDLYTREASVLFIELWAFSNHADSVAQQMEVLNASFHELLYDNISEINPALSRIQKKRLALFIGSSLEGHKLFIGHGKPWASETRHLIEMATQSFQWLIKCGGIPDTLEKSRTESKHKS